MLYTRLKNDLVAMFLLNTSVLYLTFHKPCRVLTACKSALVSSLRMGT